MTENQKLWQKELKRIERIVKAAEQRGYIFDTPVVIEQPKKISKKRIAQLQKITSKSLLSSAKFKDPISGELFTGAEGLKIESYRRKNLQPDAISNSRIRKPPKEKTRRNKENKNTRRNKENKNTDTNSNKSTKSLPKNKSSMLSQSNAGYSSYTETDSVIDRFIEFTQSVLDEYEVTPERYERAMNVITVLYNEIERRGRASVAASLQAHAEDLNDLMLTILLDSDRDDRNSIAAASTLISIIVGRVLTPDESESLNENGVIASV